MRRAGLPLFAICLALALGACGGGEATQTGSTNAALDGKATPTAAEAEESPTPPAEGGDGASSRSKDGNQGGAGQAVDSPPDGAGPEPGTKAVAAGVPTQPGGDNSVQVFGVEGAVDEREQALSTLRAYLHALAAEDWAEACAQTSNEFKEQLAAMIRMSKADGQKPEGCAETLRVLLGALSEGATPRPADVEELLSFRVEGGYAYVIFSSTDGAVRFIAMAEDDGEWKVNTTEPGELAPSG